MSLIRARQPIVTRLFPHNANRRFIVPHHGPVNSGPGQLPLGINGEEARFPSDCSGGFWQCTGGTSIVAGDPGTASQFQSGVGPQLRAGLGDNPADLDWTVLINMTVASGAASLYKFGIQNNVTPNWQPPTAGPRYFYLAAGLIGADGANTELQMSDVVGNDVSTDFFTAYPGDWRQQMSDLGFTEAA